MSLLFVRTNGDLSFIPMVNLSYAEHEVNAVMIDCNIKVLSKMFSHNCYSGL